MEKILLGSILREERNRQGLRLEDVASEIGYSTTTISNIERGLPNVAEEKYPEYAEYLGIEEQLFGLISDAKAKQREQKRRLIGIESIARINPKHAMQQLDEIRDEIANEKNSPLSPLICFLNGFCLHKLGDFGQATAAFENAIERVPEVEELKKSNIEAVSYNYLGVMAYLDNDLARALEYSRKGIKSFDHSGERLHHYYLLMLNQASYHEEFGNNEKALQVVQDLETAIKKLDSVNLFGYVRTTIYIQTLILFAEIYNNLGLQEEALHYALEGVQIAKLNNSYDHLFSLWVTTGKIYFTAGEIAISKEYYKMALAIESSVTDAQRLSSAYANLSEMLMQDGDLETSKTFALKSVEASKARPGITNRVRALIALGKWHIKANEFGAAVEVLKDAEAIMGDLNIPNYKLEIVALLGSCYNRMDNQEARIAYALQLLDMTIQRG